MSWRIDAEAHAREDSPREACGLVLLVDGVETYRACRNISTEDQQFVIDPADWLAAEDAGEIVGVFHSHPNMDAHPSAHDRASCSQTKLPWHIIGLPDGVWTSCEPEARAPLLGRQFVHGIHDCYSLIRDYYAEILGIDLPDFERQYRWWNTDQDLYRQHFKDAGFVEIDPVKSQIHDVVVMQLAGAKMPNHGGVLVEGNMLMHQLEENISARSIFGSFWRKHAVLWLRHGSQING